MLNHNYFKPYIHFSIYFICATLFAYAIDLRVLDDGLRHMSFAANKDIMQSWGNVYPHSLFGDYDPWFMWHKLLSFLLNFIPFNKLHIAVNTFSFFILMVLIHEHIKKLSKFDFASFLYVITMILVLFASFRYIMVRPDLLSGFFVMLALLLSNRFKPIFLLTILYIPFYYLFFMYTGSIGLVYLIQKKFRAFAGVFLGSLIGLSFHLLYNFEGYVSTVLNILNDQKLRNGLEVREGMPIIGFFQGLDYFILLPTFLIISFLLIWKKYDYFKENSLSLFLLITSILWVNQHRYFHLFLPMIYIFIFISFVNMNKKDFFYSLRKVLVIAKRYFNVSKTKKLFYVIAIPYSIFILSYIFYDMSKDINKDIRKGQYFNEEKFKNKIILLNRMDSDMFKAHYYNPTLKIIPSCSIGWFENDNKKMKELYFKLMDPNKKITEEQIKRIIEYTNADYYIHYLSNSDDRLNFTKLISLGIIPEEIYLRKIIFKIKKN